MRDVEERSREFTCVQVMVGCSGAGASDAMGRRAGRQRPSLHELSAQAQVRPPGCGSSGRMIYALNMTRSSSGAPAEPCRAVQRCWGVRGDTHRPVNAIRNEAFFRRYAARALGEGWTHDQNFASMQPYDYGRGRVPLSACGEQNEDCRTSRRPT